MKSLQNKNIHQFFAVIRTALITGFIVPTVICLSFVVSTNTTSAFELKKHKWAVNTVTIRASAVSFPVGGAWADALEAVISRWNRNPSNFNFNLVFGDTNVGHNNFPLPQNEVWFSAGDLTTPPAECWSWGVYGATVEADVIFYSPAQFAPFVFFTPFMTKSLLTTYDVTNDPLKRRPFRTTAMHEFGHALGLNHENDEYNIMGQDWDHIHLNGNLCKAYFGEDAADGVVSLYGLDPEAGEDVSVSHFKGIGWRGEYSMHGLTRMFDTTGTGPDDELNFTRVSTGGCFTGERKYEVKPGQELQVEFTYENNGSTTRTVDVGFYISDDNYIDTSDRLIETKHPTIGRDNVWEHIYTVTIPYDLIVDEDYYLGVIVDYTDSINEFFENDNAAYHTIKVITPWRAFIDTRQFGGDDSDEDSDDRSFEIYSEPQLDRDDIEFFDPLLLD